MQIKTAFNRYNERVLSKALHITSGVCIVESVLCTCACERGDHPLVSCAK